MFYLQDCLQGIKELSTNSIDAIVTSPPYNLNIQYGSYADNQPRQDYLNWLVDIFTECKRKRFLCPTWEHLFHFTKTGNVEINRLAVGVKYEYYEANVRGKNTLDTKPNLRDKGNVWFIPYETINSKELRGKHPATFPVKLVEDCIKLTGIEHGVVLDPFMGTGTTAVAAIHLDWDYIGYEIDSDYLEFAHKRVGIYAK
jgi:site-specific DNA-methyltransferase (adenine-specific)